MPIENWIFELGSFGLGLAVLWRLWKDGDTFPLIGFVIAFFMTTIVELVGVRETFSYTYGEFWRWIWALPNPWVPTGGTGRDVPVFVSVDWAIIFFCFWRLGDRLEKFQTRWHLLPWVFGLIAVFLDLGLDPIASASAQVAEVNASCTAPAATSTPLPDAALGVGYWVWCIPPPHSEVWLGVPVANFYAWFLLVFVFSYSYLLARKYAGTASIPIQISALVGAMVVSLTVFFTLLNWLVNVNLGTSGWVLLGALIATGMLVLALAGSARKPDTMDWWAMTSVVSISVISVGTYFLRLTAHPQLIVACGFCLIVSILLTLWVMRGKKLLSP